MGYDPLFAGSNVTRGQGMQSIVKPTLAAGAIAGALALWTANPALTVLSVAVLVLVVLSTWVPEEPPVLLLLCTMQWVQGSAKIFHANVSGEALFDMPAAHHLGIGTAGTIEDAAWLTLTWVAALAVGIRLSRWRMQPSREEGAVVARAVRLPRLLGLYFVATLAILALTPFARGGLRQVVVAAADLRWAVVFLLFWTVWRSGHSRVWLLAVFLVEVAAGFLSYFASFRVPLFLLAIAVASGPVSFRPRQVLGLVMVASLALYLGVVWSAVKGDYRYAINRGTGEQVVAISRGEQVGVLLRHLGRVDQDMLADGLEKLADRLGYIDYFAYCLEYVPSVRPHEHGRLWGQALAHVVRPRLFFPDKPALESDTRVTERYTGLDLMSWTGTTSVALGLPAEAYVDFGLPGMWLAALWVGLLFGLGYRAIAGRDPFRAFRQALAVAFLLPLATLEPSTVKFLGGYLTRLIMAAVVLKIVLPSLARWLAPTRPPETLADVRPLRPASRDAAFTREDRLPTR